MLSRQKFLTSANIVINCCFFFWNIQPKLEIFGKNIRCRLPLDRHYRHCLILTLLKLKLICHLYINLCSLIRLYNFDSSTLISRKLIMDVLKLNDVSLADPLKKLSRLTFNLLIMIVKPLQTAWNQTRYRVSQHLVRF